MYEFWQKAMRLPQTRFLIGGMGIGCFCFVVVLGISPLALLVGVAIALGIITIWLSQVGKIIPKSQSASFLEQDNLLNRDIFLNTLPTLNSDSEQTQSHWQMVYYWAISSHTCTIAIAEQEPTLVPDLLAALHTILALSKRVAEELQAMDRIKTPTYLEVAKRRIQESCDRLKSSYEQLQNLHDQTLLLKTNISQEDLPHQIQFLIESNQAALK